MTCIELDGAWNVKAKDAYRLLPKGMERVTDWMPAAVPGTIHTDLLAQKIIPDPFYRMNENDVQWIENLQWIYRREFEVDAALLKEQHIVLVAGGLDTYARITINGNVAADTENMFVEHRCDVKRWVKTGTNTIEIAFDSPVVRSKRLEKKHGVLQVALESHRAYVRKAQYSFGWDWGPKFTTSGIWRPIFIEASSGPMLRHPFVRTTALTATNAAIEISAAIENFTTPVNVSITLEGEGYSQEVVTRATGPMLKFRTTIEHPKLWWPNGIGEQPMYTAAFRLSSPAGEVSEVVTSFGIRTVGLLQEKDAAGTSFIITVNGVKIFCKGADWIPSDTFLPRITDATYEWLLSMARDANMNMLRVWGGGIYEQDIFYNLCDRLGLLVWQDFMFACGEYPENRWFLDLVKDEAEKAVMRLRHHPSIALWCGNNECEWIYCMEHPGETADDMTGAVIFRDLLPSVVKQADGSRPYWRSSPFGAGFPNGEANGNHHQWNVWSMWKDFKEYEKDTARFVTEFGFQGPANLRTWETATLPGDRHPQHPVIEFHNKQVEGQERLFRFQAAHYRVSDDFAGFVYKGQLVQANALKTAVEHWRRNKFHTAGALFWQLNDCWPVSSWAVIDSGLRAKASYFYARRFYAPTLLSLTYDVGRVEVWGTNDTLSQVNAELHVRLLSFDGVQHAELRKKIALPANGAKKIGELPVTFTAGPARESCYVLALLSRGGASVAENRYFFTEPKHLDLPDPELTTHIRCVGDKVYSIDIHAAKFAKDVWVDLRGTEAELSDNAVDIDAGATKTIFCTIRAMRGEVEQNIELLSLRDTMTRSE